MKKEIYNLQIVRGIAALLVVFTHLLPQELGLYSIGQLGVSMFFFLSGYIMIYSFKKEESPLVFLKKRFFRIYPPYLIISLPLILAAIIKTTSVTYLLHTLLLLPWLEWQREHNSFNIHTPIANNIAWTLMFELYFYLVFSVGKTIKNSKGFVYSFSSIAIISLMMITNIVHGNDGELGWYSLTWVSLFSNLCNLSFLVGMSWCLLSDNAHRSKNKSWILLLLPLAIYLITKVVPVIPIKNAQVLDLIFSCLPCWIVVATLSTSCRLNGYLFDKLHNIGQYSYSLYLFHAVLATVVYQIHLPGRYEYILSFFSIVFSLWFSKYLYRYVESVRYIDLIKNGHSRYRKLRRLSN